MQLSSILPIIVPRGYFSLEDFPGYCLNLRHPELCVTWVDASDADVIAYVAKHVFADVGMTPEAMHRQALLNLRETGALFTHEKGDGDQRVWKAMMHADALGSSRLLLTAEINSEFPEGCLVGLPDRSCAFVVSKDINALQLQDAVSLVNTCYEGATIPMLDNLHALELFDLAS